MTTAPKKAETAKPTAQQKAEAEAANAQPTEDTTRAGGYKLTDRGWVLDNEDLSQKDTEQA